ncbi:MULTISPECIES: hypothetical protein [Niallia]|uniref:hypothetical protein n=1 Tax=Niallia TaxID=2837506 RepID=UPI001EDBB62E|nr:MULTISPECIES: hypothetical protein [Niallia]MED4040992.1 hypothetical protein [Niallia taxi]UPO90990.1 hypothetical protein L8T27_027015 [Niallia sp. Man26]
MNSTDNIKNAFHVIHHTYENVLKLMDYCKTIASEDSNYVSVVNKFLRYKSDSDVSGWYIQDFILIFQNKNDIELENEWRDGPLYVMEIELYNKDLREEQLKGLPCIHLSKFEYESLQKWKSGYIGPADHWRFFHAIRDTKVRMNIQRNGDYSYIEPINQKESDRSYWGVKKIISKRIPLMDITSENVREKVFGTFDSL